MISAEGVQLAFGDAEVLRTVSLRAGDGEVVGLIGPNGSGKTTFLRTLYRALTPDAGVVRVDGRALGGYRPRELARTIAVVVQEAHNELPLTISEFVMLGRTPHLGALRRQSAGDVHVAGEALRRVGADHLADRDFSGLSGGEKQRVLIARALAQDATHLLLDEPTNHLDIHFQHEMLDLVRSLGVCTIVVLHDLNLAARYCDRLVLLHRGRVAAAGATEEVLDPRVLEPVYGIRIEPVRAGDGTLQLLFRAPTHAHGPDHEHAAGEGGAAVGRRAEVAEAAEAAEDDASSDEASAFVASTGEASIAETSAIETSATETSVADASDPKGHLHAERR